MAARTAGVLSALGPRRPRRLATVAGASRQRRANETGVVGGRGLGFCSREPERDPTVIGMKRLLPVALAVLMFGSSASAWALSARVYDEDTDEVYDEQLYMKSYDIRFYTKEALAEKWGETFTTAYRPSIRCRRTSSIAGRCRVGWFQGDTSWSGRVRVWLSVERGAGPYGTDEIRWNYALRIRRVNEYCVFVRKRPIRRCSKVISVR